ncbi:serine/threonine-protein kinase [Aquabacterium sp.]|uniref:serine/threonine-protein kinase n=1 Tax=Aquabacterium sp. TaxID=1872578 RepID=UPI002E32620D|nr:serine/threonine-protein kinase [Aquabacterium sp.]HEX5311785.1 serine/threonine-protein kinase [Aquabacterium sp.]
MTSSSNLFWWSALALVLVLVGGLWAWRRSRGPANSESARPPIRVPVGKAGQSVPVSEPDDEAPYIDAPRNQPVASRMVALDALGSTVPLGVQSGVGATPLQAGAQDGLARLHRSLSGDLDALERTWGTLKQLQPLPGQRLMVLQTLDRLGLDFEVMQRFDLARDVYEHLADLDPNWPDIKPRLTLAREKALDLARERTSAVPLTSAEAPAGQTTIGRFLVRGEIGRGAMGAVYLATDPSTGDKVALKTMALSQEFEGDGLADARARFQREAEMAGRLNHPDIVRIIESGEDKGLAYIAMEFVDGTDLGFFTRAGHLLPVRQLLSIIARVAEALAYAHTQGVTHRDVKPANIMVDLDKGVVKVMDFGVARVADAARTRTGVVLGTPTYMSPEQLAGQPVDGRSDLYSLGVSLFQLLTGKLPYQHTSMATLMRAIAQEVPPPVSSIRPELPVTLDDIVALALQKHPNTRYSNGHQMAEDLRSI